MAHEKEKAQYEEDCNNHERPWEPVFEPECFSGLNWREALPLIGKVVEFSDVGGDFDTKRVLTKLRLGEGETRRFRDDLSVSWIYIRTCPQTHQHPTITIGGVELPRPEVEAPKEGDIYYHVDSRNIVWQKIWENNTIDNGYLNASRIHLTESRAQAWADWWDETVVREIIRD